MCVNCMVWVVIGGVQMCSIVLLTSHTPPKVATKIRLTSQTAKQISHINSPLPHVARAFFFFAPVFLIFFVRLAYKKTTPPGPWLRGVAIIQKGERFTSFPSAGRGFR